MPRARVLQPGQHAIHLSDDLAKLAARNMLKQLVTFSEFSPGDIVAVREAFQSIQVRDEMVPSYVAIHVAYRADGFPGWVGKRWRPCYPGRARTWLRVLRIDRRGENGTTYDVEKVMINVPV